MALIEWTTSIRKQANWKDREYNIIDEDYISTRVLKVLKIPLFKKTYVFKAIHEINEFDKRSTAVKGFER